MALETSLLTGVVVPGDLVVLFAASTATTPTRFVVLWAAVAVGSVVGESVGYGVGRGFGERVQASRVGRWLGPRRWAHAADFLERRGPRAVFAGRFLAAVHAVLPIVAGTVRMGYRRFLAACVLGALTWSALYMTIGALAGASYRAVAERLNEVSGIVAGGLIGAVLFAGVVLIRQGIVRVSDNRVDAGVALAVAALVGFGITVAEEPGSRPPDVLAYALGVASAVVLLARRRRPVAVLGATLVVSLAYNLVGYPAGPTHVAVLVAVYSAAAAGRLLLALLAGVRSRARALPTAAWSRAMPSASRRSPPPRCSRPLPCWVMPPTAGAPPQARPILSWTRAGRREPEPSPSTATPERRGGHG
jgi:membrane-associated protein